MKSRLIFLLLIIPATTGLLAQNGIIEASRLDRTDQNIECEIQLSTMAEYMKIDLADYALQSWRYLFTNCPKSGKSIYIYGVRIYKYLLDKESDPVRYRNYLDTLLLIHDRRMELYGQEGYVLGKKGLELLRYRPENPGEAYPLLKRSVELEGPESDPAVLMSMFQIACLMYGKEGFDHARIITDYLFSRDMVKKFKPGPERDRMAESLDALYNSVQGINCTVLRDHFHPLTSHEPDNLVLLRNMTELMDRAGCNSENLYISAAEKLYTAEPSEDAAFLLARIFLREGKYQKSADYFRNAIALSTDPDKQAGYRYELAVILYTQFQDLQSARDLTLEVINVRNDWGKPYLLLGNIYASCSRLYGDNELEKSSLYWVSVDHYIRARTVDPSTAEEAGRLILRDSQYFPTREDIFFHGLKEGDSYRVGSWIQVTTTIRSRGNS